MESSNLRVLVWNPYWNHKNLGDQLFEPAFKKIFPNYNFIFTDHIKDHHLENIDLVFIGGGSFLDSKPNFDPQLLKDKKFFYVGVGAETNIDPVHQELIKSAQGIFVRSDLDKVKYLNSNAYLIPDLVFALSVKHTLPKQKKICVMPNAHLIPTWKDQVWKKSAWDYFKSEFAQSIEQFTRDGYEIEFYSMCNNEWVNDVAASHEILNARAHKSKVPVSNHTYIDYNLLLGALSRYSLIITQRYHGIVLAQMTNTPYIAICHHDKFSHFEPKLGAHIPYYGINKRTILDTANQLNPVSSPFSIKDFEDMRNNINEICTDKK